MHSISRRTDAGGKDFFAPPLPRIFAHRGLAVEAPENTLLAFLKALSAGATHLETDVHVSHDGVAIISHDPDLSRSAGRSVRVDQLSVPELHRIDLGDGQGFATLAEALDGFPEARFNIDVKSDAAVDPTVHAIHALRATERVLITSFSDKRRKRAVAALPGVATSASVGSFVPAALGAKTGIAALVRRGLKDVDAVQIPERYGSVKLVTPRLVEAVHKAGVEVHVWTVNEVNDMERLLDLGVDGLITDRADYARVLVDARA